MDELIIKGTDYSPEIIFNPKQKIYSISGWSRPESPLKFYEPLLVWTDKWGEKYLNRATINFYLEYFNTPSAKILRHFFEKLNTLYKRGIEMNIVWHYSSEEEKEEIEYEFTQDISLPVQFHREEV